MGEFLEVDEHLTKAPHDDAIRKTYLGQAHIAGTGPAGKTCRECIWWRRTAMRKTSFGTYEEVVVAPRYFGKKHTTHPLELKKQRCTFPITGKAWRLIPHDAVACRLFEASETPPPAKKAAA